MVNKYGSPDRFELKRPVNSLEQERWIFWQQGTVLYLDDYFYEKRETTRHKFKTVRAYMRLKNERQVPNWVCEQDVPLPEDVVNEVTQYVGSLLMVKRWKRQ